MQDEWMERHRAFVCRPSGLRPVWLRQMALVAIDAGGTAGATMADVHRAIRSAHLPARLINLLVDRLVEDGHVYRVRMETGGRPRIQMWSFRHAPDEVRDAMAKSGLGTDFTRPFWAGKMREQIIRDVLRFTAGETWKVREIEVAAWQIYVDANKEMDEVLFGRPGENRLSYAGMKKLLVGMVRMHQIRSNAEIDAFCL